MSTQLPYPHAHNDCEQCREQDADVQVLGPEYEKPGKRPLVLCAHCFGEFAGLRALSDSGLSLDQPVTLTVTVAPGRRDG